MSSGQFNIETSRQHLRKTTTPMERTLFSPSALYSLFDEYESIASKPFISLPGSNHVLITSVHGHDHLRNGEVKKKDQGTLKFAFLLARITQSHFYAVNVDKQPDNNYHVDTLFKDEVRAYINTHPVSLLLDIHASHTFRIPDIELGTMDGASVLDRTGLVPDFIRRANQYHFVCQTDEIFKGLGEGPHCETMVRFGSEKLQVPSIQCEINASLLIEDDSLGSIHRYCQLLNLFAEFVSAAKE